MITKINDSINHCKREALKENCKNCNCSERDCLINLINEYNSFCKEKEEITDDDIKKLNYIL